MLHTVVSAPLAGGSTLSRRLAPWGGGGGGDGGRRVLCSGPSFRELLSMRPSAGVACPSSEVDGAGFLSSSLSSFSSSSVCSDSSGSSSHSYDESSFLFCATAWQRSFA